MSKFLATIRCDAQIPLSLEDMKISEKEESLHDFFVKYEMNTFAKQTAKKKKKRKQKENIELFRKLMKVYVRNRVLYMLIMIMRTIMMHSYMVLYYAIKRIVFI